MFCGNCGKEVPHNNNFCPFCGFNVSSSVHMHSCREEQLGIIDSLISYFSMKGRQYVEYTKVATRIDKLKDVCSRAALIWGIIVSVIMSIYSIAFTIVFIESLEYGMLIAAIVAVMPGIALILIYVLRNKKRKKELAIAVNYYSKLSAELTNYYMAYRNCPIGIEFTNPATLYAIKNMIRSGRADTIKEALNLMVEDAHRRKVEDLAVKTAQYVESNHKLAKVAVIASIADLMD